MSDDSIRVSRDYAEVVIGNVAYGGWDVQRALSSLITATPQEPKRQSFEEWRKTYRPVPAWGEVSDWDNLVKIKKKPDYLTPGEVEKMRTAWDAALAQEPKRRFTTRSQVTDALLAPALEAYADAARANLSQSERLARAIVAFNIAAEAEASESGEQP